MVMTKAKFAGGSEMTPAEEDGRSSMTGEVHGCGRGARLDGRDRVVEAAVFGK